MEDALISPLSLAILSGAGLLSNDGENNQVHVHRTTLVPVSGESTFSYYIGNSGANYTLIPSVSNDVELKEYLMNADETGNTARDILVKAIDDNSPGTGDEGKAYAVNVIMSQVQLIANSVDPTSEEYTLGDDAPILKKVAAGSTVSVEITDAILAGETFCADAPLYVLKTEQDSSLTNSVVTVTNINTDNNRVILTLDPNANLAASDTMFVDFYVVAANSTTKEIQIDAEHFAGYFYVEADTLFKRQIDGKDCPAIITLPNVKIQSNFSFSLSSSGDPSTFTFTMDAMPGYTYFNKVKKVLCVIQVIDNSIADDSTWQSVMPHSSTAHVSRHDDKSSLNDTNYPDGTFLDSYITESPVQD